LKNKHCGKEYEDIKEFIENNNCILITKKEDYENYKTLLQVECACGELFPVRFEKFLHRNKRQCNACGNGRPKYKDITGQKYNHLTAIELDKNKTLEYKEKGQHTTYWLANCDCGNPDLVSVSYGSLTSGGVKSCGCIHTLSLEGQKFGKITVLDYAYSKNGHTFWNCKCECGKETIIMGTLLNTGKTKSCGCLIAETQTTHGLSGHPLYYVYYTMRQRCYKPNCEDYYLYGGKGVSICEEWSGINGVVEFYNWAINSGYKKGLEIDRIDNDGNYEPDNCRWVNDIEQANNTRKNIMITLNNETKTFMEWCRYYDKNHEAVYGRLNNGWDILEAFTTDTDGTAHFKKDFKTELNGQYKTLTEWCEIYDKKYATIHGRLVKGWDLTTALNTPTDGKKHSYEVELSKGVILS